jgi:hypothetical protein
MGSAGAVRENTTTEYGESPFTSHLVKLVSGDALIAKEHLGVPSRMRCLEVARRRFRDLLQTLGSQAVGHP